MTGNMIHECDITYTCATVPFSPSHSHSLTITTPHTTATTTFTMPLLCRAEIPDVPEAMSSAAHSFLTSCFSRDPKVTRVEED